MKHTKTLMMAALVAGGLLAGNVATQAQDSTNATPTAPAPGGGAMRGRGPNIDMLSKQLNLTDDQKPKVKAALDDMMQKIRDLRADTSLDQDSRRAKLKDIRTDMNAKLKDILTPDQYTKWQQIAPGNRRRPTPPSQTPATPPATAPTPATPPPQ